MTKLENLFKEEKNKIDALVIPEELESTLNSALQNTHKRKFIKVKRIAALIIICLFLSYNMDTLAYYGKKLVGYDSVMNGTLQELNELGKGQMIGKYYTFSDGVQVFLDKVMLDDNGLILFYTVLATDENIEEVDSRIAIDVVGIGNKTLTTSGMGEVSGEGNKVRWMVKTHKAPKFYERTIKLNISHSTKSGIRERGEISFKLDRSQAVGKSIHFNLNRKIAVDERNITVKSMTASPTATVITGQIQNVVELGIDHLTDNRLYPELIEMELYANGVQVDSQGSGMSTDLKGINFDLYFDPLPEEVKKLQLKLSSFAATIQVDEKVSIKEGESKRLNINGQTIEIEKVFVKDNETYIDIRTDENTSLPKVNLISDGELVELSETIPGDYEKVIDGQKVRNSYRRTLKFLGTGDELSLNIGKIRFVKDMDITVFSKVK